ncbi:hypothetical protein [Fastidiosibacter lacustris]|uniref:hypothetical protein n=1 Tax=Fastidiosibacter lacustris TaxID=2056695 RepID=UPI000E348751|nr:hypothetical protein [Fastidiosibacter lacustris]
MIKHILYRKVVWVVALIFSMNRIYSAMLPAEETIIAAKLINAQDNIYSIVLTKDLSNQIGTWLYDSVGNQVSLEYNLGTFVNISNAYILPIDINSNQNTQHVLLFLSSVTQLEKLLQINFSTTTFGVDSSVDITPGSFPRARMTYMPLVIPNGTANAFLVLPYQNSIDIYLYTPSSGTLEFVRQINFSGETIKRILPFKGFIIVISEDDTTPPMGSAHFIALAVDTEFATFNLATTAGVYISYDRTQQRTLLKTTADSVGIEIQNAPMPYGVIGMQMV